MFSQVYKFLFCSETNRRSLHWAEIGICVGRESSNVLNKICLFESCTFSLWYSLNHLKVLEKNSFDSWQYKKVCSIESGLRQNGHLSSEANLYFSSSSFAVIILCTTLKGNYLILLSFEDLYIFTIRDSPFHARWIRDGDMEPRQDVELVGQGMLNKSKNKENQKSVNLRGAEGKSTAQARCWWGKTRKAKHYWIKQNKHKHATNLTGAEGVALHKPGVCEAKHAKQSSD